MNDEQRTFLRDLLSTPSPAGFEADGQRVWVEYVEQFADDVRTDAYGNAVAVVNEDADGPAVAFAGHADEIGFIVRSVDDSGFLHLAPIGGADKTVSQGQYVEVHAAGGPVAGVVGQAPIHLRQRDGNGDEVAEIDEQYVDVGAADGDEAEELVDVGDPVTFATPVTELQGTRLAARGLDNRAGTWAGAEGLRRAVEAGVDSPVYAASTVHEELGGGGAKMVGFDYAPDAVLTVDLTFATDTPDGNPNRHGDIELGGGPAVGRGSANHPALVETARTAADEADIAVQIEALGTRTGTDADSFYVQRAGVPTLVLSLPNRYMHTPTEVVDTDDLDALADLLAAVAARAREDGPFAVDV